MIVRADRTSARLTADAHETFVMQGVVRYSSLTNEIPDIGGRPRRERIELDDRVRGRAEHEVFLLERDVRAFFTSRTIDLGGKTLDQYLEQLRIAVNMQERDRKRLIAYLRTSAGHATGARL